MGGIAVAQPLDDVPVNSTSVDKGGAPINWRKSKRSIANGQCLEAASLAGRRLIAVRDSVDRDGPMATFPEGKWRIFVNKVKHGDLDAL